MGDSLKYALCQSYSNTAVANYQTAQAEAKARAETNGQLMGSWS